jgi:two-component system phosphate regulon response regulator PhoB
MGKILVIDDEPFILMMLEDKLKRSGFAVITSRESVNALELVRKERPDLIVLDWMMPEISGIEICRQLKADPELSSIPVFMLTAKGQEEDEKKGMKTGANRYITKPFSPKALVEIIEKELKDRNIS